MFDNRWIILQISVWCLKRKKIYEIEAGVALFTLLPLQTFYNVGPNTKKTFYNVGPNTKKVSTVAPQHTPNSQPANTSYWAKIKALIWVSMAHGGGGCGCCGAGCD